MYGELFLASEKTVEKSDWVLAFLQDALADQNSPPQRRRRIVRILKDLPSTTEAGAAILEALSQDEDPSVRIEAAWAYARIKRPPSVELRYAETTVVDEWLQAFPSPLEYNPFGAITAEADVFLDRHFFEHPVYRQLLDYGSQSVAIFADLGDGKTSCRRMLKSSLKSPPNLVVEYTDFSALMREASKISVEDHVRGILRQASALLGVEAKSLTPSDVPWREQLRRFLESAQQKGYMIIHVLVDNVDGYAETQANLRIAELLIRHLVGNFDLLDKANLYFNFYLPLSLKERLSTYGGFRTGRIKITNLTWSHDLLQEVVKVRLQAASSPRSKVDSLMALTGGHQPVTLDSLLVERTRGSPASPLGWPATADLDRLLAGQAQGSPRRLVALVNMLFQHRAQIWHESAKSSKELFITMADWATLLEHLLRQGDVI